MSPSEPQLNVTPNINNGDDFYDELLRAHEGLDKDASDAFNARLILILCNHIGDRGIISQALHTASASGSKGTTS